MVGWLVRLAGLIDAESLFAEEMMVKGDEEGDDFEVVIKLEYDANVKEEKDDDDDKGKKDMMKPDERQIVS